jgi:hypothetical protein
LADWPGLKAPKYIRLMPSEIKSKTVNFVSLSDLFLIMKVAPMSAGTASNSHADLSPIDIPKMSVGRTYPADNNAVKTISLNVVIFIDIDKSR